MMYLIIIFLYIMSIYIYITFVVGIYSIGQPVQVAEGGTINLPCLYTTAIGRGTNNNNVEIDWFKDKGLNVRNSEARALGRISIRKDHLELNNAGIEDSGNYSCKVKAWQMDEYDSITYTLTVLGKDRYTGCSISECVF